MIWLVHHLVVVLILVLLLRWVLYSSFDVICGLVGLRLAQMGEISNFPFWDLFGLYDFMGCFFLVVYVCASIFENQSGFPLGVIIFCHRLNIDSTKCRWGCSFINMCFFLFSCFKFFTVFACLPFCFSFILFVKKSLGLDSFHRWGCYIRC